MNNINYRSRNFEGSRKRIRIISLFKEKNFESCLRFINLYLLKYPDDVDVRIYRFYVYIINNMYKEAIEDIEHLLINNHQNHLYLKLFNCYYHAGRYNDAYQLLPIIDEMNCDETERIGSKALIIKRALGINVDKYYKSGEYLNNQIICYDKEKAINHIVRHVKKKPDYDTHFTKNIDFNYLYNIVDQSISSSDLSFTYNCTCPTLIYAVPRIGNIVSEETLCNFIKVVVLPHTLEIISIFPITNYENEKSLLLDYEHEKLFPNQFRVKKLTQIDKFNARYKK